MNYIAMLDMIKVELNKQTEEIKQYIKDEYDKGYIDGYAQCRRDNEEQ